MSAQTEMGLGHTRARTTDPDTSKRTAAALDEGKLTAVQGRILRLFRVYGPMADAELYTRLVEMEKELGYPKQTSPSGCRSRRSELSKPNMDALAVLRHRYECEHAAAREAAKESWAREMLAGDGYKSLLIDTGARKTIDGHSVIVWGLAV